MPGGLTAGAKRKARPPELVSARNVPHDAGQVRWPAATPGGAEAGQAPAQRAHKHDPHYKWVALSNTTLGVLMSAIDGSIVIIHGEEQRAGEEPEQRKDLSPVVGSWISRAAPGSRRRKASWSWNMGDRPVEEEMNRPQPRRSKGSPAGAALGRGVALG